MYVMKFTFLKPIKLAIACLILVLHTIGFSSCSKSDGESAGPAINANIENVTLFQETQEGVGGYFYQVYTPYVFFKNGKFIRAPLTPVNLLDPDNFTTKQGAASGTWNADNGKVTITFTSGNKRTYNWPSDLGYPPTDGQTLEGTYETISGGGSLAVGGDGTVVNYSNMSFTKDGRYTTERLTSSSSNYNAAYSTALTSGKYSS